MSLNPNGKWHQGDPGQRPHWIKSPSGTQQPLATALPSTACPWSPPPLPRPPSSPLIPASVTPLPPGPVLRTKAVPPQVVGDGNGHGEPGQVGQQQQGGSLLMGMPEQSRAHHQPEEQQQVQQGLGEGRAVRRAALGIALDLSAAPWSQRAKFRALCAPHGSSGQPAPPPRRYLPAPDGHAALPASEAGRPPRPLPCPLLSSGALPGRGVGCQQEDQDIS